MLRSIASLFHHVTGMKGGRKGSIADAKPICIAGSAAGGRRDALLFSSEAECSRKKAAGCCFLAISRKLWDEEVELAAREEKSPVEWAKQFEDLCIMFHSVSPWYEQRGALTSHRTWWMGSGGVLLCSYLRRSCRKYRFDSSVNLAELSFDKSESIEKTESFLVWFASCAWGEIGEVFVESDEVSDNEHLELSKHDVTFVFVSWTSISPPSFKNFSCRTSARLIFFALHILSDLPAYTKYLQIH